MSRENLEKLRRMNVAFNRGDFEAAFADIAADCEWRDLQHPPDSAERRHGIGAMVETWRGWRDAFGDFTAEVLEYAEFGDHVLARTRWRAVGRESGLPLDLITVDAYEFADGRVVRAIVGYPDMATAREDLGV